ncbi:hypothetical protein G3O07_08510 [Pseudomonas laurentiana]|uniref:Uncharacterized protein n=1 Tax=Pseudomonas laurentiana TaxID=2364649 RepID=A0A6I5RPC4_9PSED|nr:hypothetical protein [Pseudomonas laurentiana]
MSAMLFSVFASLPKLLCLIGFYRQKLQREGLHVFKNVPSKMNNVPFLCIQEEQSLGWRCRGKRGPETASWLAHRGHAMTAVIA